MSGFDLAQITDIDPALDKELDAAALESALPTLTAKLTGLSSALSEDERAVLSSIVTSASLHLKALQDVNIEADYIYSKPISAAATPSIRAQLLDLPSALGMTE
ncbi:hypothetical protein DN069_32285 [Streptacidiphilus pinicola]|uniref:Uncharacterized protein n=1 Tax=Streptacidiphilus pinicola TaxID=2219663 RepID=A0A2X0JX27_9ACTN|nr:hypothetical protein [Streptacidiphilus pinicola]RAG81535.1 hypothetical protein DN069_32285 [Streptacidiphilus pinicola]